MLMPEYPEISRNRNATGVSVSRIEINESGEVKNIEVLQAPDQYIEAALVKSIGQWRFQPFTQKGQPRSVRGKLTFYFLIEGGKAFVKNPRFHAKQNESNSATNE